MEDYEVKMRNILLQSLLTISVFYGTTANHSSANASLLLDDIDGHWAESTINQAISKGYVGGYPDNTFKPDAEVSRAEFIKMLSVALGFEAQNNGGPEEWFQPFVAFLVEQGIHTKNEFNNLYNEKMTRVEVARLAVRAVLDEGEEMPENDDNFMLEATERGLLNGVGNGQLLPDGRTTRAQAVAIIERILSLNTGEELKVDKAAVNVATYEATGQNATVVGGYTDHGRLWEQVNFAPGFTVTPTKFVVIDLDDPQDPFAHMFSDSVTPAHVDKKQSYIVAVRLVVDIDTDKANPEVLYNNRQHMSILNSAGFLRADDDGLADVFHIDGTDRYEGWIARYMKKNSYAIALDLNGKYIELGEKYTE
ncbi:S-layer homology domain-containing protein [Paenibacillus sp. TRM 82003]|nr:S-layer homology domain-containing protein [Paenibacillus sp. TRM 82003]